MSKKIKIGKIKKNIFLVLAALEIFLVNIPFAFAGGGGGSISMPSPSGIAQQIEDRYHLNLESLRDFGEGMNVSADKAQAPSVLVTFNPQSPKEGEKVTATAMPMYFSNQKENMYFTWYIRHDSGNTDWYTADPPHSIEDYKIEAMRWVANGGWEPNYDTNGNGIQDGSECADVNDWYNNCAPSGDPDDDGYEIWKTKSGTSIDKQGGADKEKMPKHCYLRDFEDGINYELATGTSNASTTISCPTGKTPICGISQTVITSSPGSWTGSWNDPGSAGGTSNASGGFNSNWSTSANCNNVGTPTCSSGGAATCTTGAPVCTTGTGNDCTDLQSATCGSLSTNPVPTCDITDAIGASGGAEKHLFANPPDTGNGNFGPSEEKLFGTDPEDNDTDDDGYNDEADAAGLGQDTFSWTYMAGDRVGVAIEGTSMVSTKYNNSSYMIMWAFIGNKCEKGSTGTYIENIKGYNVDIPVTAKWLNDCMKNNYVDPTASGQDKKLDVSLSYSPDYPVNDPSTDKMGDLVSISSSIDSTAGDTYQIYYDWKVSIKDLGGNWDPVLASDLGDNIKLQGINIDTLNFRLNLDPVKFLAGTYFPGGIGYIRVKLEARESSSAGKTRKGRAETQIKVISTKEKIEAFLVDINGAKLDLKDEVDNLPLPLGDGHDDGEICWQDILKKSVCFVTKNEIIGMRMIKSISSGTLQQINWKIDGKPLPCDSANMICETAGYFKNYFPVTKNVGEYYTVVANALDIVSGQTIELVRTFQVIDPFVEIISIPPPPPPILPPTSWPKLLGTYTNFGGTTEVNYSKNVLETLEGNIIDLAVIYHPSFIISQSTTECLVNGVAQSITSPVLVDYDKDGIPERWSGTFQYTTTTLPSQIDNVTCNARYNQPQNIRKKVFDIWEISQFDTTDKYMSSTISIDVLLSGASMTGPKKFFANLYSNLPGQVMFLLKIMLTSFIIIFTSGLVISFSSRDQDANSQ